MDINFLQIGRFCCGPFGVHKKKISKDIGVARNLMQVTLDLHDIDYHSLIICDHGPQGQTSVFTVKIGARAIGIRSYHRVYRTFLM